MKTISCGPCYKDWWESRSANGTMSCSFFKTVILKCTCHVTDTQAIKLRVAKRLYTLEVGKYQILVENTSWHLELYRSTSQKEDLEERCAKTYKSLVLIGKLQTDLFWIMEK